MTYAGGRVFLFLQGPPGPFFRRLALALKRHGAQVQRVAFDGGDEAGWQRTGPLHRFREGAAAFPAWLDAILAGNGITDVVLYEDARPFHRIAVGIARARGLTTHCLNEGYVRPGRITYERQGTGGNSRLMEIGLSRMAVATGVGAAPPDPAPAGRDDRRRRWNAVLHRARCLSGWFDGGDAQHRGPEFRRESLRAVAQSLEAPWRVLRRSFRQRHLLRSERVFHLVLLQSPDDRWGGVQPEGRSRAEFIEAVIDAFAEGAAPGDRLVFRAQVFEGGRESPRRLVRQLARDLGLGQRVVFLDCGGRLEPLLDRARSVITSDAPEAQQALRLGLPVAALGRAIYCKPGLVSDRPLAAFIRQPDRPDMGAYWLFQRFLDQTSQIAGSFHARDGAERLIQLMVPIMLDPLDPYDRVLGPVRAEARPAASVPRSRTALSAAWNSAPTGVEMAKLTRRAV